MKFDFRNALIGGLVALLSVFVIVALICLLDYNFFAAAIVAVMLVVSTFALFGICNY